MRKISLITAFFNGNVENQIVLSDRCYILMTKTNCTREIMGATRSIYFGGAKIVKNSQISKPLTLDLIFTTISNVLNFKIFNNMNMCLTVTEKEKKIVINILT